MAIDPAKTERLLAKANNFHVAGNLPRAERLYQTLHRHDRRNPKVNYFLGTLHLQKESLGLAKRHLELALENNPNPGEALNNLGVVYRKLGRTGEALEFFRRSRILQPGAADVRSNLGSTYLDLGRLGEAQRELRKAHLLNPAHQDANWNLGLSLLGSGNWEGFKFYEWGFRAHERQARPYAEVMLPWRGQDLAGKTIVVWSEQGIGDEIMFATCLPDLIATGARVVIDSHPRLEKLFRRSFPTCLVVGNRKNDDWRWLLKIKADYHVPFGSLPLHFRKTDADFDKPGYMKADPERVAWWRGRLAFPRIGIAWRGGAIKTGMNRRSMALLEMAPLFDVPASWVSIQYGHVYEEVSQFPFILHDEAAIEDFTEQADLVGSLDLIVSVIQTAVHLGGVLDVPVLCLVPQGPPWKFIPGPRLPWHPSVTQLHQEDGKWDMQAVKAAILSSLASISTSTSDTRIAS